MKRSKAIDSIRGVAIILVLIWHYLPRDSATPSLLLTSTRLFWSGVDLFFVLSGFLIGSILLENANSKKYFSTFFIRRAARIIPLYTLVFVALAMIINLRPASLEESIKWHLPTWSYLTFTQNFLYAARQWFNDPFMDVTWSLAVEEQFYIFLSILIWKSNKKILPIIAITLIMLAPALRYVSSNMTAYLLPFHRADSLMLGVLLAIAWQSEEGKDFLLKHTSAFWWSLIFFLPAAIYPIYQDVSIGDAFGHLWLAFFYCNFILLTLLQDRDKKGNGIFDNKILEWFGLRSYGIYLLHKPIQILTPLILTRLFSNTFPQWTVLTTSVVILLFASEISYHLIEKPIVKLGHRFTYD